MTLHALLAVQQRPETTIRLCEHGGDLLHAGFVHALSLLNLLAILEDDDGWGLGYVEVGLRASQNCAWLQLD